MPTTNVSSVGAGKDYTTWTLWEAATDNDLVATDVIEVGEGYTETLTESVTIAGATTNATRYRIMRANSAHEHNGVFDTGHQIQVTSGALSLSEANLKLRDITVRKNSTGTQCITPTSASILIERCFIIADVASTVTYAVLDSGGMTVRSCVIVGYNVGIGTNSSSESVISNCTIIGRSDDVSTAVPAFGIRKLGSGAATVKNTVAVHFNTDIQTTATQSNNVTADGTAAGAGSLIGQIESDLRFRALADLDYVPLSSSVLAGAGADLSADFNFDIAGNTMPATWPIGAYSPCQAPTFAGAASATNNSDGSITVAWAAATANVSAIRGYKVHVHTASMTDADLEADTYLLAEVPVGRTSLDVWTLADGVTALADGTTYSFAVRAISESMDEDQNTTNKTAAFSLADTPAATVIGRITAVTATTFTATLVAAPTVNITRWALRYRIYAPREGGAWSISSYNTTITAGTTLQVTGLTAGTRYEVMVIGDNVGEEGMAGSLLTVYTSAYAARATDIISELETTLAGLGFDSVDSGRRFPRVTGESQALVRYTGRRVVDATGGLTLWRYPIQIVARYNALASQDGQEQIDEMIARFEALKETYHAKGGADIASVAGLLRVSVETDTVDARINDEGAIEGELELAFDVWEGHNA